MELRVAVRCDELDQERLHASTLELRKALLEETEVSFSKPAVAATQGSKGDPITIGTLAVTFLTSGAAVSLFKVFEAFVTRKRSIELEITRSDGQKFVLKADDVSPEQLAATQQVFEKLIK